MDGQRFTVGTFLVALVYIAIVYVLVRPGSDAAAVIGAATKGLSNLISAATGGGSFSGGTSSPTASVPASTSGPSAAGSNGGFQVA